MFFFFLLCTYHGTLDEEGLFIVVIQEPSQSASRTLLTVAPERRESIVGSGISHQMLTGHNSLIRTSYRTTPYPTPGAGQEVQSYHASGTWRTGNTR